MIERRDNPQKPFLNISNPMSMSDPPRSAMDWMSGAEAISSAPFMGIPIHPCTFMTTTVMIPVSFAFPAVCKAMWSTSRQTCSAYRKKKLQTSCPQISVCWSHQRNKQITTQNAKSIKPRYKIPCNVLTFVCCSCFGGRILIAHRLWKKRRIPISCVTYRIMRNYSITVKSCETEREKNN